MIFPLLRRLLSSTANVQPVSPDAYGQAPGGRYDRYLLVSTDPAAVQRNPLLQIIDICIPASVKPTVADALRHSHRIGSRTSVGLHLRGRLGRCIDVLITVTGVLASFL